MTRFLPLLILAGPALAEPSRDCADVATAPGGVEIKHGGDRIALAPHGPGVWRLCYANSWVGASKAGAFEVEADGLQVRGEVDVDAAGPETLTLTLPEGWHSLPADVPATGDGRATTVLIFSGMM